MVQCLAENSLRLGLYNDEDAATVVDAAFSKCVEQVGDAEQQAFVLRLANEAAQKNAAYTGRAQLQPFPWASSEKLLVERWKSDARSDALAALLEARSAKRKSN